MLNKVKTIKGYKLNCLDGAIGKIKGFYFDDRYWTIRYLVADTGNWLTARQVLISPYALLSINKEAQHINIDLIQKQIEELLPEQRRNILMGENPWDPHLHSTNDVSDHYIQAVDGEIGHVEDFILDDQTWAIRYLIINTRNWWPGEKVLVSPRWIERISWDESKVFINLACESIKQSPESTEASILARDYETRLHRHDNLDGDWIDDPAVKSHYH